MGLELISKMSADNSRTERKPELTVVYDMNDYPGAARCSSCGKEMPARRRWINPSAENLAWFADQFKLHVEQRHPSWRAESLKDQGLFRGAEAA
jgi:RNA polymerase-binding transcription factor DksA